MPIFMSNIEGYLPRVKETIGVRNHRNSRCRETLYREGLVQFSIQAFVFGRLHIPKVKLLPFVLYDFSQHKQPFVNLGALGNFNISENLPMSGKYISKLFKIYPLISICLECFDDFNKSMLLFFCAIHLNKPLTLHRMSR